MAWKDGEWVSKYKCGCYIKQRRKKNLPSVCPEHHREMIEKVKIFK